MLAQFRYENNPIRTLDINGELCFVAKDVVEALGIIWKQSDSLVSLPDNWKIKNPGISGGGVEIPKDTWVITEAAVYKLAFRSNKPEAEHFTNWVASDVLPTIRKTGKYELPAAVPTHSESLRLCADLYVKLADEVDRNLLLTEKLVIAEPKALIYDALILAGGTWDSKELAANLNCGLGPRQLLEYGIKKGYMFRDKSGIRPYQKYSKYLAMIPDLITFGNCKSKKYSKTVWLTEGVEHFIELLEADGYQILPVSSEVTEF